MIKKAIVKKTGQILDIVNEFSLIQISIKLPDDFPEDLKSKMEEDFPDINDVKMKTGKDREDYYELSDGKTYEIDELVVGIDEIREWKINNLKNN